MEIDGWSFYESLGDEDRSRLSAVENAVAAICDLRQEVNHGGFDAYLRSGWGDSAPVALAALPEVLGPEWAELLREAMLLLGPDYPENATVRWNTLDAVGLDETLDTLDKRFYRLEEATEADRLVTAYLATASPPPTA